MQINTQNVIERLFITCEIKKKFGYRTRFECVPVNVALLFFFVLTPDRCGWRGVSVEWLCLATLCLCLKILKIYIYVVKSYGIYKL